MSHIHRNAPGPLATPVTQRHLKAEVATCVGGVLSPLLSNIYLHRLDTFVEQVLIPEYNRGAERVKNPAYRKVQKAMIRARERGDRAEARSLRKQLR
jgi:hypothetical protein